MTECSDQSLNRKDTTKKQGDLRLLEADMETFGIGEHQINYLGEPSFTSKYISEKPEFLSKFFETLKIRKNSIVMSDNGRAFSEGLEQFAFKKHVRYPYVVHAFF